MPPGIVFDFLGFTHYCAKNKSRGFWLRRKTMSKRLWAKLAEVKDQIKRRRHLPIPEQGKWLGSVVRGHLAYYAAPGNTDAVAAFRDEVTPYWFKALRRRSQRTWVNWERMRLYVSRWLPPARPMHPFPIVRFNGPYRNPLSFRRIALIPTYHRDRWVAYWGDWSGPQRMLRHEFVQTKISRQPP